MGVSSRLSRSPLPPPPLPPTSRVQPNQCLHESSTDLSDSKCGSVSFCESGVDKDKKAAEDKAAAEKAAAEKAATEKKAAEEKAAQERATAEQAAQEKAVLEKLVAEKAAQEKARCTEENTRVKSENPELEVALVHPGVTSYIDQTGCVVSE